MAYPIFVYIFLILYPILLLYNKMYDMFYQGKGGNLYGVIRFISKANR